MKIQFVSGMLAIGILYGCSSLHGADLVVQDHKLYGPQTNGQDYAYPVTFAGGTDLDRTKDFGFPTLYSRSAQQPIDHGKAVDLRESAFALIDSNCEDYFHHTGTTQKWIFVTRDTVGAIGTIATGILGVSQGSSASVAAVGLGTATAYNGLDIYSKHFLYDSDNIDLVHTLVRQQLLSNQDDFRVRVPQPDFWQVRSAIFDNQNVCSDAHILTLVRNAIKNGAQNTKPESTNGITATLQGDADYQKARATVGAAINAGGTLATDQQMEGLIWLYQVGPTKTQEWKAISDLLGVTTLQFVAPGGSGPGSAYGKTDQTVKAAILGLGTTAAGRIVASEAYSANAQINSQLIAQAEQEAANRPVNSPPAAPTVAPVTNGNSQPSTQATAGNNSAPLTGAAPAPTSPTTPPVKSTPAPTTGAVEVPPKQ